VNLNLSADLIEAIGFDKCRKHGLAIDEDGLKSWQKSFPVQLSTLNLKQIGMLRGLIEPHVSVRGVKGILKDIDNWVLALSGKDVKVRTVKSFEPLLTQFLLNAPKHWVYKFDETREVWDAYYVDNIDYHPTSRRGDWTDPEHVTMSVYHTEFGGVDCSTVRFDYDDCVGVSPAAALAKLGYICETPDRLADYDHRRKLFHEYNGQIGRQFTATGVGTDNLDGNHDSDRWRSMQTIILDKGGEPARVVIDLFRETDKAERDRDKSPSRSWWARQGTKKVDEDEDDFGDEAGEIPPVEVPLHPLVACFDLRRHKRLRIDVGQLTPYAYSNSLGSKLVLPQEERDLVELLLAHKGGFQDIIKGKSGGSIVLCAGVPGTGKTLTAEVYAEVMSKPLYSVQASQLGVTPETLESELMRVFARAARWGAILLLDEADVYVAKRGTDLQQNAIVGVFLRVLEYYKGVMFLTTNRADLVDDAIASRCLARIDYKAPGPVLQKRIWRVLSDTANIPLDDATIDNVVSLFPNLTGRDVKNLLKLAFLVSESRKEPITGQTIAFVKKFKPTNDAE
jgi:hypothetical protein